MYTINNKQYTQFDIKKRCAELLDLKFQVYGDGTVHKGIFDLQADKYFDPCTNPQDTWPIVEKCWDGLTSVACLSTGNIEWHQLVLKHNCTKLEAACICYIEINNSETI